MPVHARHADPAPNPQGKGLVPALEDLHHFHPTLSRALSPLQFLRDYCLSSLVLAAHFRFRPVVDRTYFLYSRDSDWMLSLVSPDEWGTSPPGAFVAQCTLREDMTWAVTFSTDPFAPEVGDRLRSFAHAFTESLRAEEDIASSLPFFTPQLPYYRGVLATALAASLSRSAPTRSALHTALQHSALPALLFSPGDPAG